MKRCEAVCSSSVAQWHNGTKAQGFDCIIGRMHGWIYFEILTVFSDERHTVITAQRHLNVYRFSHATRRDAHSVQGPALHSLFCRGQGTKAQWHKGTRLTIMISFAGPEPPLTSQTAFHSCHDLLAMSGPQDLIRPHGTKRSLP